MRAHSILCVALLLTIPALAQQSAKPAVPTQSDARVAPGTQTPPAEITVECLSALRASELIDQHGCVAGKVSSVTALKNGTTHLSLCPPKSDCSFHASVLTGDRETVGDLSYLRGRLIAVVGDVTTNRGDPEIVIHRREQIHVAAGSPPPEFDAERAKPSSKAPLGNKRGRAW